MITIFSGGSGNDAILKALFKLGYSTKDIRIIVNAYDNGKSTGVCRAVTDTLGVSDIRKNHFKLYKYSYDVLDEDIVKFYSERLNLNNSKNIKEDVSNFLRSIHFDNFIEYSNKFFDSINDISLYNFDDFSISNIVYSVMYSEHGYDYTNKYFCTLLGIDDCVLLNSYDNAYLYAYNSNKLGEEDIVELCDSSNKISRIELETKNGDLSLSNRAVNATLNSDVIIISTGTFWSSIYPTFYYGDFYNIVNYSSARKIWFIDTNEDKDAFGVSDAEFIDHLSNLGLYLSDFMIVENNQAVPILRSYDNTYFNVIKRDLGNIKGKNTPELVKDVLEELI